MGKWEEYAVKRNTGVFPSVKTERDRRVPFALNRFAFLKGPIQTSNFTCAESNANENNRFFSFALDSEHVKFDV